MIASTTATAKRIQALKNFLAIAQQRTTKDTDGEFQAFLKRTLGLLAMDDGDFAKQVPVAKQAVTRWRDGKSVPHRALWPVIYVLLRRAVADEIEKLEVKT